MKCFLTFPYQRVCGLKAVFQSLSLPCLSPPSWLGLSCQRLSDFVRVAAGSERRADDRQPFRRSAPCWWYLSSQMTDCQPHVSFAYVSARVLQPLSLPSPPRYSHTFTRACTRAQTNTNTKFHVLANEMNTGNSFIVAFRELSKCGRRCSCGLDSRSSGHEDSRAFACATPTAPHNTLCAVLIPRAN